MGSNKQTTTNPGSTLAGERYNRFYGPMAPVNPMDEQTNRMQQDFYNRYTQAADRQTADYSDIMGRYDDLYKNISSAPPQRFSFERVNSPTPPELQEGYGYLREAVPGYRNFAETGGYSDQDIADLRARGISPLRAVYANANREVDRAKSVGGGYAPNFIAAKAKMSRDLSTNISDETQNVNARLAEDIRQGKLAGLAGLSGIGGTMGGMSLQDADRILRASLANQSADLQTQGMDYSASQDKIKNMLGTLGAKSSLYGTTPGQASVFGNQALEAMRQSLTSRGMTEENAARLLQIMGGNQTQEAKTPWWKTALSVAGTAAPYIGKAFGTGAGLAATGASMAGGAALPGAATLSAVPAAGGASAAAGGGGGALSTIGSMVGLGAGYALPLAAIMYGLNRYTRGPSIGQDQVDPFTEGPGGDNDRARAQQLLEQYGADSPMYVSFIQMHPWAAART